MMDIAARSLKTKREVITRLLDEGLYPYTKRYLGTFENHFSTIGLIGMNEAGLNAAWLGRGLEDPKTQQFTKEVLNHMRERLSDYQEEYGDLYNLEATPAESTAYRLAKHDRANGRISRPHTMREIPRTTPTAPICRWTIPRIFSLRLIFRMICRRCTPRELSSMRSLAKNCRTGKQQLPLCGRLQRTTNCRTTRCPRRILSVRTTAISPASTLHVRSAEKRQRFTAVSRDITVRSRTGTTENARSTRTELYMISSTPNRRSRK